MIVKWVIFIMRRMITLNQKQKRKLKLWAIAITGVIVLTAVLEIYVPKSFEQDTVISYSAQKGVGGADIATDLQNKGVINNSWVFKLYVFLTGKYNSLQAGIYDISPSMSVAAIANKFITGDVAKNKITLIEGWDIQDIAKYLEAKNYYNREEFNDAAHVDYGTYYAFLSSKPKKASLEGFLFPDTYRVPVGASSDELIKMALNNFGKKLTPELRQEIAKQHKTVFQIVTMASIIEKEVRTLDDKKVISGIMWKRIANGVPLQVDSTVNYITNRSDVSVAIKDTQIDSPYNTYKYRGLPAGPISNPGMDSILAAIYPTKSEYWFYISARTGQTIFSKTLTDHNKAIAKYLSN